MKTTRIRLSCALVAIGLGSCGCESESRPATAANVGLAMEVPAARNSLSPNLSVGAEGTVAMSWLEPDGSGHRLRYALLENTTWTTPTTVARGDNWFVNWADFPSVLPISTSTLAAHWLVRQPAGGYAYDVLFSISRDGGATWSEAVMPHDDGTPTEHGFVTLFPQENTVALIWLDGRNMAQANTANTPDHGMTLRYASWSEDMGVATESIVDELVCDCCQTDVAITEQGPVAVYRNRTQDETRDIYAARFVNGQWQPGSAVADDAWTIGGCPVNGPVIEAGGGQLAVAWFTAANDDPKVRLARSTDNGETFSAAIDVAIAGAAGRVGLALLDEGHVAVSWVCKDDFDRSSMCLRRVSPDGGLGALRIVSGDDPVLPLSVPQLARAGDFLVAAWTIRDGEDTAVRSSRIGLDSL